MPRTILKVNVIEDTAPQYVVVASRGYEFDAETARMVMAGDLVPGISSAEQTTADGLVSCIQRLANIPVQRAETIANGAVQALRRQREWMDGRVYVSRA